MGPIIRKNLVQCTSGPFNAPLAREEKRSPPDRHSLSAVCRIRSAFVKKLALPSTRMM